jgi:hypothetical protein
VIVFRDPAGAGDLRSSLVCRRHRRRYLLTFARRHPDSPRYDPDLVAVVAGSVEHQPGGGFGSFVLCCG